MLRILDPREQILREAAITAEQCQRETTITKELHQREADLTSELRQRLHDGEASRKREREANQRRAAADEQGHEAKRRRAEAVASLFDRTGGDPTAMVRYLVAAEPAVRAFRDGQRRAGASAAVVWDWLLLVAGAARPEAVGTVSLRLRTCSPVVPSAKDVQPEGSGTAAVFCPRSLLVETLGSSDATPDASTSSLGHAIGKPRCGPNGDAVPRSRGGGHTTGIARIGVVSSMAGRSDTVYIRGATVGGRIQTSKPNRTT